MEKLKVCNIQTFQEIEKENTCMQTQPTIFFLKSSEHACTPSRGSILAAGYDMYSSVNCVVPAKDRCLVNTNIQVALPNGCYGRIAPRSGLAVKHGIDVGAGVIDQDYRGDISILLFNFGDVDYKVNIGDRIAQLICERIFLPALVEVENLDQTQRGTKGYGSTGI